MARARRASRLGLSRPGPCSGRGFFLTGSGPSGGCAGLRIVTQFARRPYWSAAERLERAARVVNSSSQHYDRRAIGIDTTSTSAFNPAQPAPDFANAAHAPVARSESLNAHNLETVVQADNRRIKNLAAPEWNKSVADQVISVNQILKCREVAQIERLALFLFQTTVRRIRSAAVIGRSPMSLRPEPARLPPCLRFQLRFRNRLDCRLGRALGALRLRRPTRVFDPRTIPTTRSISTRHVASVG